MDAAPGGRPQSSEGAVGLRGSPSPAAPAPRALQGAQPSGSSTALPSQQSHPIMAPTARSSWATPCAGGTQHCNGQPWEHLARDLSPASHSSCIQPLTNTCTCLTRGLSDILCVINHLQVLENLWHSSNTPWQLDNE